MMVGYFSIMNVTDDQFALSISEMYQKIGNLYFLGLWAFEAIVNKNIITTQTYILKRGDFYVFINDYKSYKQHLLLCFTC